MLIASSLGGLIRDDLNSLKIFLFAFSKSLHMSLYYFIEFCFNRMKNSIFLDISKEHVIYIVLHMTMYFTYYMKFHIK